jgi:hypothetical protein
MHSNDLRDQQLRTRLLYVEWAAMRLLNDGDQEPLRRAMSNDWTRTIGEAMEDPFATIRMLSDKRHQLTYEWVQEMKALRAAGYSVRAIAQVAGVSHDTVWKRSA